MNEREFLKRFEEFAKGRGLKVRSLKLFLSAFTHKSFFSENPDWCVPHNERLEFLGDAVVSSVVSHLLFERFPQSSEGDLSKMRAWLVREERLASVARRLGLGDLVLLGKGEERAGGRNKNSILAGLFEAFVGALYLDSGYEAAFEFLKKEFSGLLEEAERGLFCDYRSRLQELTQARWAEAPEYKMVKEEGPSHSPSFEIEVVVRGKAIARGKGRSKKEAAQEAAKLALQKLKEELNI